MSKQVPPAPLSTSVMSALTIQPESGPPVPFVLLDEATILEICHDKGLSVVESGKYDLFLTASQLQKGEITTTEFCDLAKSWCNVLAAPAVGPLHHAPQIVTAALDVTKATAEVAAAIKARAETANISARYLSALELASGLAPESIRIVAAVQEVTEKSIIEHEVIDLQAEARGIKEFLTGEIDPLLKYLEQRRNTSFAIDPVRRMRVKIDTKIESQRKAGNIYRQRVEQGIANMRQVTYYMKTNQLPRYAAACSLEILLRAYHAILGLFDPEDFMVTNDWKNLHSMAIDRCQSLVDLFAAYAVGRCDLLEKKSDKTGFKDNCYVNDAGATLDTLLPRTSLLDLAKVVGLTKGQSRDDDVVVFSAGSWSSSKACQSMGDVLHKTKLSEMQRKLGCGGLIWEAQFQPHVRNMHQILQTALQRAQNLQLQPSSLQLTTASNNLRRFNFLTMSLADALRAQIPLDSPCFLKWCGIFSTDCVLINKNVLATSPLNLMICGLERVSKSSPEIVLKYYAYTKRWGSSIILPPQDDYANFDLIIQTKHFSWEPLPLDSTEDSIKLAKPINFETRTGKEERYAVTGGSYFGTSSSNEIITELLTIVGGRYSILCYSEDV